MKSKTENELLFLTPDGRWRLLQNWIAEKPTRQSIVDRWVDETPEEVWPEFKREFGPTAARWFGPLAGALFQLIELPPLIRPFIVEVQNVYRERRADEYTRKGKTHRKPLAR